MESLKESLGKFILPKQSKNQRKVQSWQDYAATICQEFKIEGQWKKIIFRMAKSNKAYLEGKVASLKELEKIDPSKWRSLKETNKLGNYLFAMLRKKKD